MVDDDSFSRASITCWEDQVVALSWKPQASSCDGDAQLACASLLPATMKEEHYAMRNPFQLIGVYACANLAGVFTKDADGCSSTLC